MYISKYLDNAPAETEPAKKVPGIADQFVTHYAIGANKYAALPIAGLTEMAGNALGVKSIADAGKAMGENAAAYIAAKEQENPSQKFQDIQGIGDAAKWAGEQITEFLPQAALMAVSGGIGAGAGRAAASQAVKAGLTTAERIAGKKAIAAAAEKGAELTGREAASLAANRAGTIGAQLGNTANSIGMETATVYQGQEDGKKNIGRSLLYGTAAGLLDSAVPNYLLQKTGAVKFLPGMSEVGKEAQALVGGAAKTFKQRVGNVAATMGEAIQAETAQEGIQTVLERIGSNQAVYSDEANKNGFWKTVTDKGIRAAVNPDAWGDIVESMAAGGLLGGVMGGGMSAASNIAESLQRKVASGETGIAQDETVSPVVTNQAVPEGVNLETGEIYDPGQAPPTAILSNAPEMTAPGAGLTTANGEPIAAQPITEEDIPVYPGPVAETGQTVVTPQAGTEPAQPVKMDWDGIPDFSTNPRTDSMPKGTLSRAVSLLLPNGETVNPEIGEISQSTADSEQRTENQPGELTRDAAPASIPSIADEVAPAKIDSKPAATSALQAGEMMNPLPEEPNIAIKRYAHPEHGDVIALGDSDRRVTFAMAKVLPDGTLGDFVYKADNKQTQELTQQLMKQALKPGKSEKEAVSSKKGRRAKQAEIVPAAPVVTGEQSIVPREKIIEKLKAHVDEETAGKIADNIAGEYSSRKALGNAWLDKRIREGWVEKWKKEVASGTQQGETAQETEVDQKQAQGKGQKAKGEKTGAQIAPETGVSEAGKGEVSPAKVKNALKLANTSINHIERKLKEVHEPKEKDRLKKALKEVTARKAKLEESQNKKARDEKTVWKTRTAMAGAESPALTSETLGRNLPQDETISERAQSNQPGERSPVRDLSGQSGSSGKTVSPETSNVKETKETDKGFKLLEPGVKYGIVNGEGVTYEITSVSEGQGRADTAGQEKPGNLDGTGTILEQFALFFPEEAATSASEVKDKISPSMVAKVEKFATGTMKSSITHIKSPADAAHVAFPLASMAQEQAIAIVTNKSDKILGVVQHSSGVLNQALIHPRDLLGVVHDFPGAANVWLAHNHPSGDSSMSPEDLALTRRIMDVAEGSALTIKGHVTVGLDGTARFFDGMGEQDKIVPTGGDRIRPINTYMRRIISLADGQQQLTNQDQFTEYARDSLGDATGLVLVDTKNRPVAFLPMTMAEMEKLKTGKRDSGSSRIMRSFHEVNAASMIARVNDVANARAAVINVANFANALSAGMLDAIDLRGNSMASLGTMPNATGTFYAVSGYGVKRRGLEGDIITVLPDDNIAETDKAVLQSEAKKLDKIFVPMDVKGERSDALRKISEAFGNNVVFYSEKTGDSANSESLEPGEVAGFVVPGNAGTVYLNTQSNRHLLYIIGHETSHLLELNKPDEYYLLLENLLPYIDPAKYSLYEEKLRGYELYKDLDKLAAYKEFVGELVGELFTAHNAWSTLAKEKPSVFKKVADAVLAVIKKIKTLFTNKDRASEAMSDLAQANRIILEALKSYASSQKAGAQANGEGVTKYALNKHAGKPFFSKLTQVVESKFPGRADSRIVLQMFQAWQKKGEFTADELEQSGLKDFLAEEKKVTKQDVFDYLQEQQTEFADVVLQAEGFNRERAKKGILDELYDEASQYDYADGEWWYETIKEEKSKIYKEIKATEEEIDNADEDTEYYYTFEGERIIFDGWGEPAENELLDLFDITDEKAFDRVPETEIKDGAQQSVDEYGQSSEIYDRLDEMENDFDAPEDATHFSEYTEPGAKEGSYREMFVTAPVKKSVPSFEEWLSLQNISDAKANEIADLFGVAKREDLIDTPDTRAKYEKEKWAMPKADQNRWQDGHSQYSDIQNPIVRIRFNEREVDGKKTLFIEEMQGPSDANQQKMPEFLRKRIYDIGVKRVLAYAKENGFDGISWTSGEMQAERYDLSKHIKSLRYTDNGWLTAIGNDSQKVINEAVPAEKLADYIGKDIAKKLLEAPLDGELTIAHRLEGMDLKVGGEGLISLYDKMLPALFKKYGKEAVGEVNLKTRSISYEDFEQQHKKMYPDATNENMLDAYDKYHESQPVPFIPITDKTATVYPMYSKSGEKTIGLPSEDIRKAFEPIYANLKNAPPWRVVQSAEELPAKALKDAKQRGFPLQALQAVYLGDEVVYVADNFVSLEDAKKVILEEVVVHHGLRGIMDQSTYEKTMLQAALFYANKRHDEWHALAKDYNLDTKSRAGRIEAAEEMLGRDAREGKGSTMLSRVIAAVRDFFRSIGFDVKMSDAEIRELLGRAQRFVEGKETTGKSGVRSQESGIDYGAMLRSLEDRGISADQLQALVNFEPAMGAKFALAKLQDNDDVPDYIERAVEYPRKVPTQVSLATKAQTKDTLNEKFSVGEIMRDEPVRLTTVEELHDILKTGKLREGRDFEGRNGISAQLVGGNKPVVAYGPNDRISAAIIFPAKSNIGRGEQINEVKVDSTTDVATLRFVIDGHKEILTFDQLNDAIDDSAEQELSYDNHIRYALAPGFSEYVKNMDGAAIRENMKQYLNPLDFSRLKRTAEDITPQSIQNGISNILRNPVFEAETDKDFKPFVDTAIEREENKVDILLKYLGWDGQAAKPTTLWERIKDTYSKWGDSDKSTKWGRYSAAYQGLSVVDRKAVDAILVRGDVQGKVYKTYDIVKADAGFKTTPSETAFKVYQDIRTHIDTVVAKTTEQMIHKFMLEAGMSDTEVEQSIKSYRQRLAERHGWLPRNHGEGDYNVNVYHVLINLKWQINGGTAYLPFYPGTEVAAEIQRICKNLGLKYKHERNGQQSVSVDPDAPAKLHKDIARLKGDLEKNGEDTSITEKIVKTEILLAMTSASTKVQMRQLVKDTGDIINNISDWHNATVKGMKQSLKDAIDEGASKGDIRRLQDEIDKMGDGNIRVKVYMKKQRTERLARKHHEEVKADFRKAIPESYLEGERYEANFNFADQLSEEMYTDMKNDFAMEQAQLKALERAAKIGEISKAEAAGLRHAILQTTAETLMARGAGRYQIRRADYLIEGYDKDNTLDLYHDYMGGTAGMLSKAIYAKEQFENFRYAPPKVKRKAEKYIKDSLRNMGYADQVSGNLRALASFMYLGFKVSSAVINSTQVWTLGVAELGRHTKRSAIFAIGKAQKDIFKDNLSQEENDLFNSKIWKIQEMETAVHEMSGSMEGETGKKFSKHLHILSDKALMPFQELELLNRKTMILAAYRSFVADGMSKQESIDKALEVNRMTNFEMSRANLPGFARKPLGRTIYALQSFMWNNWNWIYNRATSGKKEDMKALLRYAGAMAVIGGAMALPGGDELDKLYQMMFGRSPKLDLQKWMGQHAREYGTLGEMVNGFAWHGLASAAGVNISNAIRLQIPIVSPLIGDKSLPEAAGGVFTGLMQKGSMAALAASRSDVYRTVENISPEFIAGGMRAYRQMTKGATTYSGKLLFDENGKPMKYSAADAAKRMLGFQPSRVSERSELAGIAKSLTAHWKEEREDLLARLRMAEPSERKTVNLEIIRFNHRLFQSQAKGLVPVIKAETIRRALAPKPNKKKMGWLRGNIS